MRVTVLVRPKTGIRDPQGEAIGRSLGGLGYPVSAVSAGSIFDLEIDTDDPKEAERLGAEMAARVLSNDLIEGFEVSVG
ncbi:MAG: phosphoribosylformylglycinamidine synthase, purS protein [Thermoleophilia bacterium]|nr:phosphoribosylformylglycinamidine synthase subunit PurS [Actinomycetota bacterium]MSO47130.1 phosphoribosylformylglycinamidine synthase, purS protein [Thermoleophilia bacterium]